MKRSALTMALATGTLALAPFAAVVAAELPPAGARPLSAILLQVEQQTADGIAEAEFDHGRWEVKLCSATACRKHYFNAFTGAPEGERRSDRERVPRAGAPSIAAIVQRVEAAGVGVVTSVDFERGNWEVKLVVPPQAQRSGE